MRHVSSSGANLGGFTPFAHLAATLALIGVAAWSLLAPPPQWYYARVREIGWVPAQWNVRLAGHWTHGFETSTFVPCPGFVATTDRDTERWWMQMEHVRRQLASRGWSDRTHVLDTTAFIAGYAELSPRGNYGHLGAHERAVDFRYIVSVQATSAGDCARAEQADLWTVY